MRNRVEYNTEDGRMGGSAGFPSGNIAVIGVSEIVPSDIISLSGFSKVESIFGDGPLRDFLQGAFSLKKKPTVYVKALTGSIPGTKTDVTAEKTGAGSITISGEPRNEYDIQIIIDSAGGLNEATFHYLVDNLSSKRITVPNTPGAYVIPKTGLMVTFDPGVPVGEQKSFEVGDKFSFSTTAPAVTNSEILEALETLIASKKEFSIVAIAGASEKALWVSLNSRLMTEEEKNNRLLVVCEARYLNENETIDAYITALTGTERPNGSLKRVQVVVLHCEVSDINSAVDIRSPLGHFCGHLASCKVQERAGKVKLQAIPGLSKIYPETIEDMHLSDLDDAGYVTPVTYYRKAGVFFSRGRLMTELTSDFRCDPELRVLDKALTLVYERQIEYLNDDVFVNKKDGSPEGLDYFLASSKMPLDDMKRAGEITYYEMTIPPAQNILTTEELKFELAITPKGYIGVIRGTAYYRNPALEVS